MPHVSVILVNFNGAAVLPRCLAALRRQTFTDFELIVVDNGSTDGSTDGLEAAFPGLRLVRMEKNTGFAAGNNTGARLASGQWLALLNTDAFPAPGWLAALVEATHTYPEFSFFASHILQARRPTQIDSTGDLYHVSGNAWHRDLNLPDEAAQHEAGEVFSPCAAAALYSRQAFLAVGGFDEDFFSYHEDVDLGFRLRLQGQRCLHVPQAVVEHLGAATFGVEGSFTIYHGQRNLVWCYVANMPGYLFWKHLPQHLVSNLVFLIYYSLRGQARTILRAKWDALLGLFRALRKRRAVQRRRQVGPRQIEAVLEHGWLQPYLLGRRADRIRRAAGVMGAGRR